MKLLMMKIMLYISILSTLIKTPMTMMIMLMMQTVIMIMIMNKMFNSSWYPMISFLMMIGGLLIIFMYMTSISSNEKFKMNLKMLIFTFIFIVISEEFLMETQMNEKQYLLVNSMDMIQLTKMYNKTFTLMLMMMLYLLFSMICINKMIKFYEGPLRSKTYEQDTT